MEMLLFLVAWPFLILVLGLLAVSGSDVLFGGMYDGGYDRGPGYVWPLVGLLLVFMLFRRMTRTKAQREAEAAAKASADPAAKAAETKKDMYVLSIAGLLPLFVRYALDAFRGTLPATVLALLLAFGAVAAGLAVKGNRVVAQGSLAGGIFTVILLYGRLWDLGEGARIVATAAGLAMAIGLAVVKFKDKLS